MSAKSQIALETVGHEALFLRFGLNTEDRIHSTVLDTAVAAMEALEAGKDGTMELLLIDAKAN